MKFDKKTILLLIATIAGITLATSAILSYKVTPERCVGCGRCVIHCPVDAIVLVDGKAIINPAKCIQCGMCFKICPIDAIQCVRDDTTTKSNIEVSQSDSICKQIPDFDPDKCISCSGCAKVCPEKAIEIFEGYPVIDPEKCTLCGNCTRICPTEALTIPAEKDS